ncbi:hypothetical protein [Neomoorella thermoacetica]|uniref:hypothetical protein n=1 Tax=Neomoorella thermoacetica TaxID=1525 RepID=UPI0011817745|nr:hypothetical protein [Moorella thermoacetica]
MDPATLSINMTKRGHARCDAVRPLGAPAPGGRYSRGKLALDEKGGLLDHFSSKANDAIRGHTMDFVGRSLMNKDIEVPAQLIERLKALWEHRIGIARRSPYPTEFTEELSVFGWWFAPVKFDLNWALSPEFDRC